MIKQCATLFQIVYITVTACHMTVHLRYFDISFNCKDRSARNGQTDTQIVFSAYDVILNCVSKMRVLNQSKCLRKAKLTKPSSEFYILASRDLFALPVLIEIPFESNVFSLTINLD